MLNSKAPFTFALLLGPTPLIIAATSIALTAGMIALATPAEAQGNQWCSRMKGATSCMYQTKKQCRASISGRGGTLRPQASVRGLVHRKTMLVHLMHRGALTISPPNTAWRDAVTPHSQLL